MIQSRTLLTSNNSSINMINPVVVITHQIYKVMLEPREYKMLVFSIQYVRITKLMT